MAKASVPATVDTKGTALSPVSDDFFQQQAGAGLENVTAGDMLVPRLTILQALSPQLNPKKSEFIEGAKIGSICDVGTGDLFEGNILFLPVYYRKEYLEWAPRASGEGLVAIHPDATILEQTTRNERKQAVLPNGNIISETAQFFGLNLSADRRRCFLPMTSTQLKKARKWITLATSEKLRRADGSEYVAPLSYRTYEIGSAEESNNQGDWSGWTVNRGPALPELDIGVPWFDIGHEAAAFRQMIIAGEVRGDVTADDLADGAVGQETM